MKDGGISDAVLYCQKETQVIGSSTYYLAKDVSTDTTGATLFASTNSVGKYLFGTLTPNNPPFSQLVFQLSGIAKILAATIYATYRACRGAGTVNGLIDIRSILFTEESSTP